MLITREVVKALVCLDRYSMIHRDIKPSNIMLGYEDQVKLLDFGLAKNPSEDTINIDDVFRGTPHFTSPEQILSEKDIDIRSDIYSFGFTFFAAATGVKAFDQDSAIAVMRMHRNDNPPLITDYRTDLNGGFVDLIHWCMKKNREDRPSLRELVTTMEMLTLGADDELLSQFEGESEST